MFKKVLAGLATVAVALGMVALTAGPASAHHNEISPNVTCLQDYTYRVDWSVQNSETVDETITGSSDTALVPVGTTFGNKETKVFTEYFAAPTSKTLTLSAKWTNNNTNTNEGKLKKSDFPPCAPNHVPITLCHATPPATAAQGWNKQTIDDDAIVTSGHDGHALDIIPAFNYWTQVNGVWTQQYYPGKNLDTLFSGIPGSAILGAGCSYKATPGAPVFAPATCTGPGQVGQGSVTIPTTAGVRYEIRFGGTGGYAPVAAGTIYKPVGTIIEVKAFGDPSWVGLNDPKYWSYTVPSPGDCIYEATPVMPDVTNITACGTYGSVVPKSTPGVVYTFTIGNGTQGAWQVKAVPATGYKFVGDQVVYFNGDVGKYTTCVTPTEPGFSPSQCEGLGEQTGGSYTIPEKEGVTYQVKIGDDPWADIAADTYPVTVFPTTVEIRAVANEGYTLKDYTGPWSYSFKSAGECLTEASPVAPDVANITACDTYGSVVPKDTLGVVYTLTSGDGKSGAWEVTATPAPGYYFESGPSVVFSGNLGVYTECANPLPALYVDEECIPITQELPTDASTIQPAIVGELVAGTFTIPVTEGVQYTVSINDGPFVDYEDGVYTAANGDKVVVKAQAKPGYTLTGVTEWSHVFVAFEGECDPPTLGEVFPAASSTNQTCTAAGTIIVLPTAHVIYELDGVVVTQASTPKSAGTYTVTAYTDSPEWGIFGPNEWVLTIAPATGPCGSGGTGGLAMTGSYFPILGLSAAAGLLVLGGAVLFLRRRNAA